MARSLKPDATLIRDLAELLDETGLTEIEISAGDQHVRVARHSGGGTVMAAAPASAAAPAPAKADGSDSQRAGEAAAGHPGAVASPMVGTVYVASEPGAPPFVTVGASVEAGDTLFIIEAMKTMNPVRAPRGGRVAEILIEDAQPVEYGETLAVIA